MATCWNARRVVGIGALACSIAAARAVAQNGSLPTFRVDVGVVNLNLSVTDPHEHYVTDLTAQDIVVYEDGVRQSISLFTRERLPISLTLLIDGSTSMKTTLPVAQAAAVRFIRTLGPGDDAQVVEFTRRYAVLQETTSDRVKLEAAVAEIQAHGETSLYESLYVALKDLRRRKPDDPSRRRAVVLLTDGEDTASNVSEDQLMELARRAEVAVYAIGLFHPTSPATAGPAPNYFLTALGRETGGRAYFPRGLGELEGVYGRIADELRTLYGVGYVSANVRRDGAWRRIVIETLRPNLIVRHRLGYHGPAADPRAIAGTGH